jgi:hypothetical protein
MDTDAHTATLPLEERRQDGRAREDLVMFLERDQLVHDAARAVPRAHLSAAATAGLWALRVFVIVVSAMVIYTFIAQIVH